MKLANCVFGTTGSLALSLSCWAIGFFGAETAAAQSSNEHVIYLNQAWSQADRELFYQLSQGSSIASYDIFLNLEVAGSQELFRSDANSERYGLIPQAANPKTNPDALPVGMAKRMGAGRGRRSARLAQPAIPGS